MNRIQQLYEFVARDPGRKASTYTYELGWGRSSAQGILANAESAGVLFAEDDDGNLFPAERLTPEQIRTLGEICDQTPEYNMHNFWVNYFRGRGGGKIDGYVG